MSKYFLDTEFLEGTQKKVFGNTKPTIDLISIGVVCEDGREYYAISKDFNLKEAWGRWQQRTGEGDRNNIEPKYYWLRENVLKPIYWDMMNMGDPKELTIRRENSFNYKNFKRCLCKYGKTNKQIAEEIKHFVANRPINSNKEQWILDYDTKDVQFYGYYSAYDHVALCWLFGKMIDLPKGFPMYCIDLKQTLDEKMYLKKNEWGKNAENFDMLNHIKTLPDYPKQINKHNALTDAKWNLKLYEFLNTF